MSEDSAAMSAARGEASRITIQIDDKPPVEEYALFNPAFLAVIARAAIAQHERRSGGRAIPAALMYLVIPLTLHKPTRDALPRTVAASMLKWVLDNPQLVMLVPSHVKSLREYVSAGLRLGLREGAITSDGPGLRSGLFARRSRAVITTPEIDECISVSEFLGRWMAEQHDTATILAIWGLEP